LPHAWHRYTQDLAALLAQILQTTQLTTTKRYLYSLDRLAVQSGNAQAWYIGAGLGSMRLTLDDAGAAGRSQLRSVEYT
jgi:hypothetical protein